MLSIKYPLIILLSIVTIIILWIFLTSISDGKKANAAEVDENKNQLYRQVPRDNDADYSLPKYIPTPSGNASHKKIEFKAGGDNHELYYLPVAIPQTTEKAAPAKPKATKTPSIKEAPQAAQQIVPSKPAAPTAPLQPQPRQPETPVYVPQYQQQPQPPQYYEQPAPSYQAPTPQENTADEQEVYPYYYY